MPDAPIPEPERPVGGGFMGSLIRAKNWSDTAVGPIEQWPDGLLTTVEMLVNSRHPMFLWWGPELTQFYNDAYLPSFGEGKHPDALGQEGPACWGEIWPIIGPQIEGVMSRAEPTWNADALVPIFRNGRIEEVYWTYGYSPVFNPSGAVAGTLVVCTETTARVLATRRQTLLRVVAERVSLADRPHEVFERMLEAAATDPSDLPFVLVRASPDEPPISTGVGPELRELLTRTLSESTFSEPTLVPLADHVVAEPWPEPVREALFVPLQASGWIGFGLSSRLRFDPGYRAFLLDLVDYVEIVRDRLAASLLRRAAEIEHRDLLMQAPVGAAILIGPEFRFELANPHYVELVGREVVGKTYLEALPELEGDPIMEIVERVYHEGVPFMTEELVISYDRDATGTPESHVFRFNLQPIRDAEGAVYGMTVLVMEITDLVRARQQQAQARDELEAANHAKDEFLAMLGHELRNPLAPIVTALELMKLRKHSRSPELAVIENQVAHLIRLVDDLLDVAKITRGKIALCRELVDVEAVLDQAIEMSHYVLEERRHRLELVTPSEPITWWGDRVRLAQVIANLLTNAARYTPPGGSIRLCAASVDDELEIRVRDDGIGIEPELLPRIFDHFTQGTQSSDRAQGGLGLGLAIVKNLVGLHGGTVEVTSEGRGQGSEFTVRLPLPEPTAPAPAQPDSAEPEPAASRRRILLVDDNADAADMLAALLRRHGHEVDVAYDGVVALERFAAARPDVVILDIGLPVMDGYELAERLSTACADEARPCRLIAVTGYGQRSDRNRTRAAGFVAHFVKPVDVQELLDVITK